jgi:hypothetical protein
VHQRGVFGCFDNEAAISLGERLAVTEQKIELIPYAVKERLRWFLSKGNAPAAAGELIEAIARAMPRFLEKLLPAIR